MYYFFASRIDLKTSWMYIMFIDGEINGAIVSYVFVIVSFCDYIVYFYF